MEIGPLLDVSLVVVEKLIVMGTGLIGINYLLRPLVPVLRTNTLVSGVQTIDNCNAHFADRDLIGPSCNERCELF